MRHLACILATLGGMITWATAQDTLLLFHPTAYNLDVIETLVNEGMLDLEGYHVLGVYHIDECYQYDSSRVRIVRMNPPRYSLCEITDSLGPGNLFGANGCSGEFSRLFNSSRGALFMGGPDIPPSAYGEPVHLLTRVTDPGRHYMELSFLFHLLGGNQDPGWSPYMNRDESYLISGICLGMQTINVAAGGTLIQDIPSEVYNTWIAEELLSMPADNVHRNYTDMVSPGCDPPTSYHFHRIRPGDGSLLTREMEAGDGTSPLVLSSHHQSVEKMGKGLRASATSMDGKIIEAIEHERYPHVLGVQFHPEKPGLFVPGIVHPLRCGDSINFSEVIMGTESFSFHHSYWKYIGGTLQSNRR